MFLPHILNQFLCDIFKHNILLQKNTPTTYPFSIINNVARPLKYGALMEVR